MNNSYATSGNSGPKVRSDCQMTLELRDGGGIVIDLKSKVEVLYGESIKKQCAEILKYFEIRDAFLRIDDSGALPFVIAARLESAIKMLTVTELEYLPELLDENKYSTSSDRFRFSRL
jgi:citrate lyase subunit beta/citryl-CoA lyase